jgi:putative oxidoreductase
MKGNRSADTALLILRVGIGLIAIYYGCQKTLGWFGGQGPRATLDYMSKAYGIPAPLALLAMAAELVGGAGMLVGLFTSVAAFGFACVMAVATFENWRTPGLLVTVFTKGDPAQAATAFYTVALLVAAVALVLMGGGAYSLDNKFFRPKGKF